MNPFTDFPENSKESESMSHELYHSRISSGQILLHQNPSKSDRSINVLVVDDQNFNIAAIKAQLESLGVASDEAISG